MIIIIIPTWSLIDILSFLLYNIFFDTFFADKRKTLLVAMYVD